MVNQFLGFFLCDPAFVQISLDVNIKECGDTTDSSFWIWAYVTSFARITVVPTLAKMMIASLLLIQFLLLKAIRFLCLMGIR